MLVCSYVHVLCILSSLFCGVRYPGCRKLFAMIWSQTGPNDLSHKCPMVKKGLFSAPLSPFLSYSLNLVRHFFYPMSAESRAPTSTCQLAAFFLGRYMIRSADYARYGEQERIVVVRASYCGCVKTKITRSGRCTGCQILVKAHCADFRGLNFEGKALLQG